MPPHASIHPEELAELHKRDSLGALQPAKAELDAAVARGYAEALESSREENLDRWRTVLASMLEAKFGELDEAVMERIAEADQEQLEQWVMAVVAAAAVDQVFAD